jgi:hypothetical protein
MACITVGNTAGSPGPNVTQEVVPKSGVYGMRKAKNFDITLECSPNNNKHGVIWALIYIPEGVALTGAELKYATDGKFQSIYEPNQHLIASGIASPQVPIRVFSPLARNLNSGDAIYLVLRSPSSTDPVEYAVLAKINYAICL